MQYWQLNVSEGNAAFASNQFARAALHYQAGLDELRSIERFIHCDSPPPKAWIIDQYLPALIVSYLNLCDSKLKKYAFILAKQLANKPSSLLKLNTIINTHTIINHNIH